MITEFKRMECEGVIDGKVNFSDLHPFRMPNVSARIESEVTIKIYERIRTFRTLLNRIIKQDVNIRLMKCKKNNKKRFKHEV